MNPDSREPPVGHDATTDFPYRWAWSKWPTEVWTKPGPFQGMACRVVVRGRRNKALLEFEDGTLVVASRNGLRRREPPTGES